MEYSLVKEYSSFLYYNKYGTADVSTKLLCGLSEKHSTHLTVNNWFRNTLLIKLLFYVRTDTVVCYVTVIATRTGIHRNHHFDTIERCTPFAPPIKYSDIRLGCSSFYGKIQSSIFFHEKEISTCRGQYLLLLTYNSLVKHQSDKLKVIMVIMLYYLS